MSDDKARSILGGNASLSESERAALAALATPMASELLSAAPCTVSLSGPPGTGKSTLSTLLRQLLIHHGCPTEIVALDNYYFSGAERAARAARSHPLWAERGVPGTHDFVWMCNDIQRLQDGDIDQLALPLFDKYRDELAPESAWQPVHAVPSVILLDGWCFGCPPQSDSQLAVPTNDMDATEDATGAWRESVNHHVALYQGAINAFSDQCWFLAPPGWESVIEWRWRQECDMPVRRLETRDDVIRFLAPFERWVRHMLDTYSAWADVVVDYGESHEPGKPRRLRR